MCNGRPHDARTLTAEVRKVTAELDAMIAKIRRIPQIAKRAAPDVAVAVRAVVLETINAGTTPEGEAWAPRKEDGARPLAGAARALKVAPIGTRIFFRIAGPEARHHLGRARGGVRRGIIPTRLTPRMTEAVIKVLSKHFREITEGG
jgi:hypothetical protein